MMQRTRRLILRTRCVILYGHQPFWAEDTQFFQFPAKEGPYRVTSEEIEITPLGSSEDE